MKAAIVTGGAGFLGSHLVAKLHAAGFKVVAVDNFSTGDFENRKFLGTFGSDVLLVEADVCQEWTWLAQVQSEWLASLKYVFHFASPASPPVYKKMNLETMWVNSLGLERALNCANTHKAKVIFASTSEIYGDTLLNPQSEKDWGHVNSFGERSCYNESKRFGEALIYSYNERFKTRHGLVRIFNTYGPRMNPEDGRVIINFLSQALRGQELTIYGDGSQTRSFCYVDDLIDGVYKYAQSDLAEPVNLGNPEEYSILQIAERVQTLFRDKNIKLSFEPLPLDDPKQRRPDILKALSVLPDWKPLVSLETGLLQMKSWLQERL